MRKLTKTVTIQKPVEVEQVVGVVLELSVEEAAALAIILAKIGGDPTTGVRGHTESISHKLLALDISFNDVPSEYNINDLMTGTRYTNGINFDVDSKRHPAFTGLVRKIKESA